MTEVITLTTGETVRWNDYGPSDTYHVVECFECFDGYCPAPTYFSSDAFEAACQAAKDWTLSEKWLRHARVTTFRAGPWATGYHVDRGPWYGKEVNSGEHRLIRLDP